MAAAGGVGAPAVPPTAGEQLCRLGLYCYPPFYIHPLKPLWNLLAGEGYKSALANFAEDHQSKANIVGHLGCLLVQVLGNFAFLHGADRLLQPFFQGLLSRLGLGLGVKSAGLSEGCSISTISLFMWSSTLWLEPLLSSRKKCSTGPPVLVSALSVGVLALAHRWRASVAGQWQNLAQASALFDWVIAVVLLTLRGARLKREAAGDSSACAPGGLLPKDVDGRAMAKKAAIVFVVRQGIFQLCKAYQQRDGLPAMMGEEVGSGTGGPFSARAGVNLFVLGFLALTSRNPHGKVTPFHIALLAPSLAVLTNQSWLYFYGMGYFATALQGLCHELARENPTLARLASFSEELGHTVYFPNLLLETASTRLFQL